MRAAILLLPFQRLTSSLIHKQDIDTLDPLSEDEVRTAQLTSKAINRAKKFTPWHSTCLAQALTAQRILRKQNIPGVFYLGVKKGAPPETKLAAHAWSQCGDIITTGAKERASFTVISVFIWERQ